MTPGELVGGIASVLTAIAAVQGYASNIAAIAPQANPTSPKWWQYTRAVLDGLAANAGNAKNAPRLPTPAAEPIAGPGSVIPITRTLNP